MSAGPMIFAGVEGAPVEVSAQALDALRSSLTGPVLEPGDSGFEESILIWNGMVRKRPSLVVRPRGVPDVRSCIAFALEHGILLSVKGGGHNIAGTSLADRALTLVMADMRGVEVDPVARLARAEAGCLLQDVDRATQEHGLAAVLGFVSETGAAGLTLGGGFGYLTRRFGWTVDNLQEVEVVTADGQLRHASDEQNQDLFWALKGGGGNFGVATAFTFRLHDVGPQVTGGLIAWSADHGEQVAELYREVSGSAPRELTMALTMRKAPATPQIPEEWHGRPIVAMIACHTGDPRQADRDLAPIKNFGDPIVDGIVPKTYVEQQSMLDLTQPKGMNYYWKSEFVPELPDGLLSALRESGTRITSPRSQVILFQLGGAVNEIPSGSAAFGNREATYVCNSNASWPPDDPNADAHIKWAREAWDAYSPYSTGGNYINFQTEDEQDVRTRTAYRENYERLSAVKAKYDPDNFFRSNRNIAPQVAGSAGA